MKNSFRFVALPAEQFAPLFDQSDAELQAAGARRLLVDEKPGFPCRVSLVDAEVGETVLLLPFTHHDVPTPYRASGPIFVRREARTAQPSVDEVPVMFRHRLLSIRAYDRAAMLVGAQVLPGAELEAAIQQLFVNGTASTLHIHNAGPGCYNCSVVRA
jgi:uncharacterized protein DUF1203